ncbi:hypothetical protein R3W88_003664 [Solanum pinnatisectum]|uniref:Zinc finger GRF-type domain-containing protein n=1 Tax=Solanum pinnatisectum TaxID=50273 RepID=A0AAV9MRI2_9SOLN|nr:hypothetical protein R3W88_003664 [Solanum pinnatisectum]
MSRSMINCQCGIATRIFMAFTPTNVGRRFYECCNPNVNLSYNFINFHIFVANLIHNLKKENDNLPREKKALETR